MGGEGGWDHINTCRVHSSNWTRAHNHVLTALESICNSAGYATKHKHVLTSAGQRRADLEILNIQVAQNIDLLVDITMRHDFVGAGHDGLNQGQLRNRDNPDKLLDCAAADKIRHYRAPYRQNRHVAFLPACMTTSGRIHGEFLRLFYFISNKQAVDYLSPWTMTYTKQNFVITVASSSTTTNAPLEWHVPRLLRGVAPPRQRVASSTHLATNSPFTLIPTCLTGTSAT